MIKIEVLCILDLGFDFSYFHYIVLPFVAHTDKKEKKQKLASLPLKGLEKQNIRSSLWKDTDLSPISRLKQKNKLNNILYHGFSLTKLLESSALFDGNISP